jgi:hypothetical protein
MINQKVHIREHHDEKGKRKEKILDKAINNIFFYIEINYIKNALLSTGRLYSGLEDIGGQRWKRIQAILLSEKDEISTFLQMKISQFRRGSIQKRKLP